MSHKKIQLSAALIAAALLATAAGARTLHPQATTGAPPAAEPTQTTQPARATTGSASVDTPMQEAPPQLRGVITCSVAGPGPDCAKLEQLLAK
jgi:hypothetical protein